MRQARGQMHLKGGNIFRCAADWGEPPASSKKGGGDMQVRDRPEAKCVLKGEISVSARQARGQMRL